MKRNTIYIYTYIYIYIFWYAVLLNRWETQFQQNYFVLQCNIYIYIVVKTSELSGNKVFNTVNVELKQLKLHLLRTVTLCFTYADDDDDIQTLHIHIYVYVVSEYHRRHRHM